MKKKTKFKAGENIITQNANWSFDGTVPKNFEKHIKKSVPLYEWSHEIGLKISDFFLPKKSTTYDLGCSTGTFLNHLALRHEKKNINLIGVDEIKQMVDIAKTKKNLKKKNVKILHNNLNKIKFKKCNFITSFFTIQFIHPSKRQTLIDKVYKNLEWGGGFVFFEKVRGPDARFQDMISQMYAEYKYDNGYNPNEIFNKSKSLKGVMEPFSTKGNLDLLKRAGFKDYLTVFKYLCFEGFLAIK
tara:strand:+ start:852 stop:1580 length:729 start_codon:yes stop_codon:yes gene_type:complete